MRLPLFFLAATAALLVYWYISGLKLPQPPLPKRRRLTLLGPVEALLQRELDAARLNVPPRLLVEATAACGALGAILASPFRSGILMLISAAAFSLGPYQFVRYRIQRRAQATLAATEPALVQIARLCEIRRHPYLALQDALPLLAEPLRTELDRALAQAQAGVPLPEALREMATRCCDNFYLHQLAELVAINVRDGGDLAGSLERLAARLRTLEELRAEETAELFGYKWLTRILFGAAVAPLPYWALTGSASLRIFGEKPLAQGMLIWVVLSGLAIASLPYWLAIDD